MNRFKDLVERYRVNYNEKILRNRDKLIEAFVLYYGEEFRENITDTIDNLIITWNISPTIGELYDKIISYEILYTRVEHSAEILRRLGFEIDKIECEAELGDLYFKKNDVLIYSGRIWNTVDIKSGVEFDYLLQGLFGPSGVFNYEYDENILYNFYSLSDEDKCKVVKYIFGKDEVEQDSLEKIDSAIEYMDMIRDMKDCEVKYADFLIVRDYMDCRRLDKRIMNKLFGTYSLKLIGSLNGEMERHRFKNYLNGRYSEDSFMVMFSNYEKGECFKIVTFPIMCTEDVSFIHEVNHAVTASVLGYLDDRPFEKHGICVDDDNMKDLEFTRMNLEEYLNQASALEITDIFHKLGGYIFEEELADYSFIGNSFYNGFLPLINSFYSTYRDVLKSVRLTNNGNRLFMYADRDIFLEYVMFINGITERTFEEVGKVSVDIGKSFATDDEIEYADNLVKKMRTDEFFADFGDSEVGEKKTDFGKFMEPEAKIFQKKAFS